MLETLVYEASKCKRKAVIRNPPDNFRIRPVRTAARALIVRDGELLTIKMRDHRGIFYILPGGGQNPGEILEQTIRRECREELGTEVRVRGFAFIREYIGKNHGFRDVHRRFHQVEVVFHCELVDADALGNGQEEDRKQIGWAWLPIERLGRLKFYPKGIVAYFRNGAFVADSHYLGDIN